MDQYYLGSGLLLTYYIKKHGKTGIMREILEFAKDLNELNTLEFKYVTKELIDDPLSLNIDLGGRNLNTRTPDVSARIGKSISELRKNNPERYPSRTGTTNSITNNIQWRVISPAGEIFEFTGGFKKFCIDKNISYTTMCAAVKDGWIPRKGSSSGWQAFNLTTGQGTTREVKNVGKYRSGENNPMFGKTHSDEYKEKLRIRMTENNINKKLKKKRNKMDISIILDVWEVLNENLPTNKKEDAANKLIKVFSDHAFDLDDLEQVRGEDHYLDLALDHFTETDPDEEVEEE